MAPPLKSERRRALPILWNSFSLLPAVMTAPLPRNLKVLPLELRSGQAARYSVLSQPLGFCCTGGQGAANLLSALGEGNLVNPSGQCLSLRACAVLQPGPPCVGLLSSHCGAAGMFHGPSPFASPRVLQNLVRLDEATKCVGQQLHTESNHQMHTT